MVEKNFTDTIRRIKEKWYKEQKRQIQFKLRQADESGDKELTGQLTCQKQNLMRAEKELR
jgi:DNA primase